VAIAVLATPIVALVPYEDEVLERLNPRVDAWRKKQSALTDLVHGAARDNQAVSH